MNKKIPALGFLVFLTSTILPGRSGPAQLWTSDLSSSPDVQRMGPIDVNTSISLAYMSESRVALGFLLPQRVGGVWPVRRSDKSWRAMILAIHAKDGTINRALRLEDFVGEGAAVGTLELAPANSGELLVIYANELLRISPAVEVVARRSLPATTQQKNGLVYRDYWHLVVDPAGSSALLVHSKLDRSRENHWISPKDLQDTAVSDATNDSFRVALLGGAIVYNGGPSKGIIIESRDSQSQQICPTCRGAVLRAFGRGLIFVASSPAASYSIINRLGEKVFDQRKGFGADTIGQVSGSANSDRAAFAYGRLVGSLFGWRSKGHVVVVDANLRREVVDLRLSDKGEDVGEGGWQVFNRLSVAISPDGKRLAVLNGHFLTLWEIP